LQRKTDAFHQHLTYVMLSNLLFNFMTRHFEKPGTIRKLHSDTDQD